MIETLSTSLENTGNLCRLCLNKELLQDINQEQDLQRWISDFLAIVICIEDRMSQAICDICRMRIIEFQHFRMHCQEVQGILKSMIKRNDDRSLQSEMQSTVVKLECSSESALATNEDMEKDAGVGPVGIADIIVLEAVKIEPPDDYEETSEIPLNKTVTKSNYNDENQAFEPNSERTLSAFAESAQIRKTVTIQHHIDVAYATRLIRLNKNLDFILNQHMDPKTISAVSVDFVSLG
nr:uncharacterized protein LOC109421265 [Aedes albopictus]